MNKIAIMQPTYIPWSGYFALMEYVDTFVILDSVQLAKRSWQMRNKIKTQHGEKIISIPVYTKGKRDQLISQTLVDQSSNYANNHLSLLKNSYSKAKFFNDYFNQIFDDKTYSSNKLSGITIGLMLKLKDLLGIKVKIINSTDILGIRGEKANLMASICKKLNCDTYISPLGSKEYLDASNSFKENNIPIEYFKYNHPEYKQLHGEFIPYLSVIDMIFNCGKDSLEIIKSGIE